MRPSIRAAFAAVTLLALASPAAGVRRRAFVTSATGNGNLASWPEAGGLGGLAAADEICQTLAADADLDNAGAFRAWLSTAATDAWCHVQGLTGKRDPGCAGGAPLPAGPWYRYSSLGSSPVSESLNELSTPVGAIYRSMLFDENGVAVDPDFNPPTAYWTGTDDDGSVYPNLNCASWVVSASDSTGVGGDALQTAQAWTLGPGHHCNAELRLLCLEPGVSEATGQRWTAPGSLVFLTSATGSGNLSSWPEAGGATGLAAGDAICATLAAEAHLPAPDSFVAWLSTAAVDARDRVTSNGPFRRIDGVIVATTESDLTDGSIGGSIHQKESGAYQIGQGGGGVFTGTVEDGTASATTCSGWTTGGDVDVTGGLASSTQTADWTDHGPTSCQYGLHLYCISNVTTLFWDGFDLTEDTSRWTSVVP